MIFECCYQCAILVDIKGPSLNSLFQWHDHRDEASRRIGFGVSSAMHDNGGWQCVSIIVMKHVPVRVLSTLSAPRADIGLRCREGLLLCHLCKIILCFLQGYANVRMTCQFLS